MDKFDELLNNKIQKEKAEFTLPKSFEDKLEHTLKQLDSNKKHKINKKIFTMVASLAVIVFVGFTAIKPYVGSFNEAKSDESKYARASQDSMTKQYSINEEADYIDEVETDENNKQLLDGSGITSMNIECFSQDSKYKFIDKQEDIEKIVSFINSISVKEVQKQNIGNCDFLIKTNGSINHSIMFKDNIMNIDDKWYKIDEININSFKGLYDELQYEEKEVAYCGFN